uniref:NADH dehydrogenase [ubiquinone] 1 alpha subcomplex subunit 10, mitochondrial n=1 Tax=Clastoptera arizonana TaxID=38151 RepID=A0A1B6DH01_9HEMI
MAVAIFGMNLPKLISLPGKPAIKNHICGSTLKQLVPLSAAYICGKALRDPNKTRPPPYPYKEKNYKVLNSWFDKTTSRFDENSKVIVVDGPIAAGKSTFAKALAEDLDMLYIPPTTMDDFYINPYGYDMRQLDDKMPKSFKSYDDKNFCLDPKGLNSAFFQIMMYKLRYSTYIDALAHLLNTGQGVVLVRSCFSDFVFMEASFKEGYISKQARSVYNDLKKHTIYDLLKPHLCIYLDIPVAKVQENIKKRNLPHQVKGKALTESFLTTFEDIYKRQFLKQVSEQSELLIYDWSDGGDVEVVIEDLERLDFDQYTIYDAKLSGWRIKREQTWSDLRQQYTTYKHDLMTCFNVPRFDCPELIGSGEDEKTIEEVWFSAPGMKYDVGFNADQGDTGILLKNKVKKLLNI